MITLTKPKTKTNWPETFRSFGLAALEAAPAAFGGAPNIPNILREAFAAKDAKVAYSADEAGWVWLNATLIYALCRLGHTVRPKSDLTEEELAKVAQAFIDRVLSGFDGQKLKPSWLTSPADIPFLADLVGRLDEFIKEVSPETPVVADLLKATFRVRMREAGWATRKDSKGEFQELESALSSSLADGDAREQMWDHHHNWIRWKYLGEPIFSPKKASETSLATVYQPLRCYWHTTETEKLDDGETKRRIIGHVADLHETMHEWLRTAGNDDPIKLISGGPGSGKSSFARAFAGEAILKTPFKVIFVELQRFRFSEGFESGLKQYLTSEDAHSEFSPNGSRCFARNPMANRTEDVLFVFDGLDELSADKNRAAAMTLDFVKDLKTYLGDVRHDTCRVRALVLGRAAAFGSDASRELPVGDGRMLCAAPIRPLKAADLKINGVRPADDDVRAPENMMADDQRETYWTRWTNLVGEPGKASEAVTSDAMIDLNAEPLLLHLLILSGFAGDRWEEARDNRNVVYRQIFDDLIDRNMGRDNTEKAGWTKELMGRGLECFGLAAWRSGGGRAATREDFFAIVENRAAELIEKGLIDDISGLRTIAIQSHGRQGDEDGYEFIHKSFGEYLTARALIADASDFAEQMLLKKHARSAKEIAASFAELVSNSEITEEVIGFLKGETRLSLRDSRDQTIEIKDALTKVFSHVQNDGFPSSGTTYRQAETHQRCAEGALLTVLSAIAGAIPQNEDDDGHLIKPHWPTGETVRRLQFNRGKLVESDLSTAARTFVQRIWRGEAPAIRLGFAYVDLSSVWLNRLYLRRADLSRANLIGADLSYADLSGADLSGADLSEADLSRANLFSADLSKANLSRANLSRANLIEANLNGAELNGANLNEANLNGANLIEANLIGADLNGANLSGADLRGANLSEANLRGANLSGADLRGANLSGADLRGAKCNRLHIDSARLHFADLRETIDLSQDQINSAKGSKAETKLPDHLTAPEHWDA